MNDTNTKELKGVYGIYPDTGYLVDFDSDRTLNTEKLLALKTEEWLDPDTRAIQVLWTIKSSRSQTYFTFIASLEWDGDGGISNRIFSQNSLFFY